MSHYALQAEGRRFEPVNSHKDKLLIINTLQGLSDTHLKALNCYIGVFIGNLQKNLDFLQSRFFCKMILALI